MRLATGGEPLPLWVIADRQTAGRGRAGRSWLSPPGNFTASIALQCDAGLEKAGQLSLIAGISIIDAIGTTTPLARDSGRRLKWPNDVLLGVAKAGGILVESTTARGSPGFVAVIGIGLNLHATPDNLGRAATALSHHGQAPAPMDLLVAIDRELSFWLSRWQWGENFSPIREAWMERAGPKGEALTINTNSGPVSGTYEGLAATGALQALVDGRLCEFSHGDVVLVASVDRDGRP